MFFNKQLRTNQTNIVVGKILSKCTLGLVLHSNSHSMLPEARITAVPGTKNRNVEREGGGTWNGEGIPLRIFCLERIRVPGLKIVFSD